MRSPPSGCQQLTVPPKEEVNNQIALMTKTQFSFISSGVVVFKLQTETHEWVIKSLQWVLSSRIEGKRKC